MLKEEKMIIIKKTVWFSAAHRLYNDKLSEEENQNIFGKCCSPNYHGHNYKLEVAVSGEIDPKTGMVINFTNLKKIIDSEIIDKVDHRNLNTDVDFLKDTLITAENLAKKFFEILDKKISAGKLHSVSVSESEDSTATYSREQ